VWNKAQIPCCHNWSQLYPRHPTRSHHFNPTPIPKPHQLQSPLSKINTKNPHLIQVFFPSTMDQHPTEHAFNGQSVNPINSTSSSSLKFSHFEINKSNNPTPFSTTLVSKSNQSTICRKFIIIHLKSSALGTILTINGMVEGNIFTGNHGFPHEI